MSRIERDVKRLMPVPNTTSLLDGLLVGALIGAAGASLVVVGQIIATRRLARRYGVSPKRPPLAGGAAGVSSPL